MPCKAFPPRQFDWHNQGKNLRHVSGWLATVKIQQHNSGLCRLRYILPIQRFFCKKSTQTIKQKKLMTIS